MAQDDMVDTVDAASVDTAGCMDVTVEDLDWGNRTELFAVACIHCEGAVFRFSSNYLAVFGGVTLVCPGCGGHTHVAEDGEIRVG